MTTGKINRKWRQMRAEREDNLTEDHDLKLSATENKLSKLTKRDDRPHLSAHSQL